MVLLLDGVQFIPCEHEHAGLMFRKDQCCSVQPPVPPCDEERRSLSDGRGTRRGRREAALCLTLRMSPFQDNDLLGKLSQAEGLHKTPRCLFLSDHEMQMATKRTQTWQTSTGSKKYLKHKSTGKGRKAYQNEHLTRPLRPHYPECKQQMGQGM